MASQLYEVTVKGDYFGEQTINRWTYQCSGTPAAVSRSFALASAFGGILDEGEPVVGTPIYLMGLALVDAFTFVDIFVKDLYSNTDFYQTAMGHTGARGEQGMAPFNAFGFQTNITDLSIKRGSKRLAGVSESLVDAGGLINGANRVPLDNIAQSFTDVLTYTDEGGALSFTPVILGREFYDPDENVPPVPRAYRYYKLEADQLEHVATSLVWSAKYTVRSQGSRQYGRGQ